MCNTVYSVYCVETQTALFDQIASIFNSLLSPQCSVAVCTLDSHSNTGAAAQSVQDVTGRLGDGRRAPRGTGSHSVESRHCHTVGATQTVVSGVACRPPAHGEIAIWSPIGDLAIAPKVRSQASTCVTRQTSLAVPTTARL